MTATENIPTLQRYVDALQQALKFAQDRLTRAKVDACGVKIGDIVVKNGEKYRVSEIDTRFSTPWLKGNPLLKNGEWGRAWRNLYDGWTKEAK